MRDPLAAPDAGSPRRVECLDDPFGRGYGSKAYCNVQEYNQMQLEPLKGFDNYGKFFL